MADDLPRAVEPAQPQADAGAPDPEPLLSSGEMRAGPLWCVQVRGPDDVQAVASYEDAVRLSDGLNWWWWSLPRFTEDDPLISAIPALWEGTPESHAASLATLGARGADYALPTEDQVEAKREAAFRLRVERSRVAASGSSGQGVTDEVVEGRQAFAAGAEWAASMADHLGNVTENKGMEDAAFIIAKAIRAAYTEAGLLSRKPSSVPAPPRAVVVERQWQPLVDWLADKNAWSLATFGPGTRAQGVVAHIRKELVEIEADPTDLSEWVDVVLLALDGAARAGHSPSAIVDGLLGKQQRNVARSWPDWRTADPSGPIEHERATRPTAPPAEGGCDGR